MKISALICTRNRALSLEATLRIFFLQRLTGDYDFELVVVDNNSIDETKEKVARFASEHPGKVRYVFEPRQGLCFARNAAIEASSGDIIVFTDDDVLVDGDWLNEIHREFIADPDLFVLGGRVLIARDGLQKVALMESDERYTYHYPESGGVIGANMAFRREVFDRIGGFDVRLGAGRFLPAADDYDIFYRAMQAGYKILYAPNILVYHDHDRETVEQACRLEYGYGKGYAAFMIKHAFRGDVAAMRMFYWLLYRLPGRWAKKDDESIDTALRRRAWIRGIMIGIATGPFVIWMLSSQQTLSGKRAHLNTSDGVGVFGKIGGAE